MPAYEFADFRANFEGLVEAVEGGACKEVLITRNGRPVARLVPIATPLNQVDVSRRLGLYDGQFEAAPSQEAFDADNEEIAALFYREKE